MEEWDPYIASGVAIQNQRSTLSLAHQQGVVEGLRLGPRRQCKAPRIDLDAERHAYLDSLDTEGYKALLGQLQGKGRWP